MSIIPTLEIIFALCLMFLPAETKSFTIKAPELVPTAVIFSRQENGTWKGVSEDGKTNYGNWKMEGLKLVVQKPGENGTETMDLSQYIKKDGTNTTVRGEPVTTPLTTEQGTLDFSMKAFDPSGPVHVIYTTK